MRTAFTFGLAATLLVSAAAAQTVPVRPGQCVRSVISELSQRLQDSRTGKAIAGSGSAVTFSNRLYQVSYDQEPAIRHSRVGDPVQICLVELPHDCPPGDTRGRVYKTVNLRTKQSWTLPDAEHACGGA
jgi:hypothetical protein